MKASTRFKFRYRDGTANKDGKIRGPRQAAVFLRNPRFTRYNEKGLVDKEGVGDSWRNAERRVRVEF
jgi:hypothetical protein